MPTCCDLYHTQDPARYMFPCEELRSDMFSIHWDIDHVGTRPVGSSNHFSAERTCQVPQQDHQRQEQAPNLHDAFSSSH